VAKRSHDLNYSSILPRKTPMLLRIIAGAAAILGWIAVAEMTYETSIRFRPYECVIGIAVAVFSLALTVISVTGRQG
jgi:hypothetical protein